MHIVFFIDVAIAEDYMNSSTGNEVNITVTCIFPLLRSDTTIKWITQNVTVVNNTGVLMLSGNYTINNTLLTCSIDSTHQLYTSSQTKILITVQSMLI